MPSDSRVWTTLLTQPSYVAGVLVLNRTLRSVSSYPLVIMITDTLPESCRDILRKSGLELIEVGHISPAKGQHPGFESSFNRFDDAWTKLSVFGLTQYERVILIDADMLFLRCMDELFDMELPGDDWIAAAPACVCNPLKIAHYPADWIPDNCALSRQSTYERLLDPAIPAVDGPRTSHLLNSGLVVLKPSTGTLESLIDFLNTSPTIAESRFADQDVIAAAFHGRWRPLPWWVNALKPVRAVHANVWKDTEVRNIHYILDKPWSSRPVSVASTVDIPGRPTLADKPQLPESLVSLVRSSPEQASMTDYAAVHQWWWVAYVALVEELKGSGDDSVWQEMDRWVAA